MRMKASKIRQRQQRFAKKIRDRIPDRLKTHEKRVQTISSVLPNLATLLALCAGLSSVRFALEHKWELAVISVMIAGILDATDGKLARLLDSTSRFGAELDSLADFISFGVSPALVIYLHTLHHLQGLGWILTLFFTVCMGLRLARFNTLSIEGNETSGDGFFLGVPAPAAALIALSPLMFSFFARDHTWGFSNINPYFYGIMMFIVACLMVSKIPAFSIKKLHISGDYLLPFILLAVFLAGALYVEPWLVLSCAGFGYLGSLPFSIRAKKKPHASALPSPQLLSHHSSSKDTPHDE